MFDDLHAEAETKDGGKRTLSQIAKVAGVSVTTASRVFKQPPGRGSVREETRQRVFKAAEGYIPRSWSRHTIVGIIIPTLNPTYAELARFLTAQLREVGLTAILTIMGESDAADQEERRDSRITADSREDECIRVLTNHGVAGIIAVPAGPPATGSAWKKLVNEHNIPVVFVDRKGGAQASHIDVVAFDDQEAAKTATQFLLKRQHSRIGILSGPKNDPTLKTRVDGIREAIRDFNDSNAKQVPLPDSACLRYCSLDQTQDAQQDREKQAEHLLTLDPLPTAIFTLDPLLCEAVLAHIIGSKKKVPSPISLVTFVTSDNVPQVWAHALGCELTTIMRPLDQLAMRAVRQLRFLLDRTKEKVAPLKQPERIVYPISEDSLYRGTSVGEIKNKADDKLVKAYEDAISKGADAGPDQKVVADQLLNLGKLSVRIADYDTIPHLERSQAVAQILPEKAEMLLETESLSPLGVATWHQGNPEKAEEYFRRGLNMARQLGRGDLTREFLMRLGKLKGNQGEYEEAQSYLLEGLELAEAPKNREHASKDIVEFHVHLAWTAGNQGYYKKAHDHLTTAKNELGPVEDNELLSGIQMNFGWIAHCKGELDEAQLQLGIGLDHAELIPKDYSADILRGIPPREVRICGLLENLCTVARYRGDRETALSLVEKGLPLAREVNHLPRLCGLLESQAWVLIQQDALKQARRVLEEGLDLALHIRYPVRVCGLLHAFGCLHLIQARDATEKSETREQQLQEASNELMAAYLLAKRSGHRFLTSSSNLWIGELHYVRQQWRQAVNRFRQAKHLAENLADKRENQPILVGWAQYGLARAYSELRDTTRAREYFSQSKNTLTNVPGLKQFGFHQVDDVAKAEQQLWRQKAARAT